MESELSTQNQEVLIGEWDEAERTAPASNGKRMALIVLASIVLTVLLIVVGIWQHDSNYYFGAAVLILLIISLFSQLRRNPPRLHIVITTLRLLIGKRQYLVTELAGFWLSRDGETTVVNLEMKKPGILPVSFLYGTLDDQQAREVVGQVLPELEPRLTTTADQISRYFRF